MKLNITKTREKDDWSGWNTIYRSHLPRREPDPPIPFAKVLQGVARIDQPGISLVAGLTGDGKSALASNAIESYLFRSKNAVVVLSCDEDSKTVYERIACLRLNIPLSALKGGLLKKAEREAIATRVEKLKKRLFVNQYPCPGGSELYAQEVEGENGRAKLADELHRLAIPFQPRGIPEVSHYLKRLRGNMRFVGLVVIDYLQMLTTKTGEAAWLEMKEFSQLLHEHARTSPIPIILLAQLKPGAKSNDFFARLEGIGTIGEHVNIAIEIRTRHNKNVSDIIIQKDKFGSMSKKAVRVYFDGVRYRPAERGTEGELPQL